MFVALFTDKIYADWVMVTTLTCCMIPGVITTKEALAGFANEGVNAIVALFVVAGGITNTGALDWYMNKLLGTPRNVADAQLRIFVPITIMSWFMKNTPLVVLMLPIVGKWSKNIGISAKQLLIPLSFASIFGGTCTLIGTSTNLVVYGLLQENYPDVAAQVSFFSLGRYGIPIAFVGGLYILIFSQWLIPERKMIDDVRMSNSGEDILIGARVTAWSPAAGRSIKRSGLRDTGGIYLVSVKRAATGNTHRAVGQEFVLQTGDILYFTGHVEEFGAFCEEHCLEVLTNEDAHEDDDVAANSSTNAASNDAIIASFAVTGNSNIIGIAKSSMIDSTYEERMYLVNRLSDYINNRSSSDERDMSINAHGGLISEVVVGTERPQIIIVSETTENDKNMTLIGINVLDRPGLLRAISKELHKLKLQIHHTEAAVYGVRSMSVWRCEELDFDKHIGIEDIWSSILTCLVDPTGIEAVKERGTSVIRATVTANSSLISKTAQDLNFRTRFGATIVTVQRGGRNVRESLKSFRFLPEDLLVLHADHDSPLLTDPPAGFYDNVSTTRTNAGGLELGGGAEEVDCWQDLRVSRKSGDTADSSTNREYLAAMRVSKSSSLSKKSAEGSGLTSIPGLVLVSIERPLPQPTAVETMTQQEVKSRADAEEDEFERAQVIQMDEPLEAGDILWFAGSATALTEVRKVPGLVSNLKEKISKLEDNPHERRLVQAVVSGQSDLIGKTAADVKFRTRFGAAIIAINRGGKRMQEHPGKVQLQGGDVLLLEAGPSFVSKNNNSGRSFVLVSEVENSTPPRLKMLLPAVVLTLIMIVVSSVGWTSLLIASVVTGIVMVMFGIMSQQEARDAIAWDIFLTIAAAFGIGTAMQNSGLATILANFLVAVGDSVGIGEAGLYGAVYLATVIISSVVTNTAAAALIFPIGMQAAIKGGGDPVRMSYCIMLSASASFMTPFGYTTNLLIYGPGGYKFMDFVRFGTPLQLILWVFTVAFLSAPLSLTYVYAVIPGAMFIATGIFMSVSCKRVSLMMGIQRKSADDNL